MNGHLRVSYNNVRGSNLFCATTWAKKNVQRYILSSETNMAKKTKFKNINKIDIIMPIKKMMSSVW